MLTARQHEALVFIDTCLRETGVCPSFEEIAAALGLAAKSNVHRLVNALVERGAIRRVGRNPRSLEVLRPPGTVGNRTAYLAERNQAMDQALARIIEITLNQEWASPYLIENAHHDLAAIRFEAQRARLET